MNVLEGGWYKSSAEGIENKIFSNELARYGVTLVSAITEYEVADLISILWPPSLLPPSSLQAAYNSACKQITGE